MGTTLTSGFENTTGMAYTLVVAIEGIPYLLHNGVDATVATAWAATEWTQTLPGLQVKHEAEAELEPWSSSIKVTGLSFGVMDHDGADTFGKLAFGSHAGVSTFLNEDLDCTETAITVLSTAAFAASGSVNIGTERIDYTGVTATSFTGCSRGMYAPFKAESESLQRFARSHDLPIVGDGVVTKPKVSSLPRVWTGRWVGVWLHRKTGTTIDTKAQAQCIWAGKIVGKRDEANGMTWFECEDVKAAIRGCTLLYDQFNAKMSEGVNLVAGATFRARDSKADALLTADPLTVVTGAAAGANEISAGITTIDELADALNNWLYAEKQAGRLNFDWTWSPRSPHPSGDIRSQFHWSDGTGTDTNYAYFQAPSNAAKMMGFRTSPFAHDVNSAPVAFTDQTEYDFFSPETPYRTITTWDDDFDVEDVRGTWWNNTTYLPSQLSVPSAPADEYGVFQVDGGAMWLVRRVSATRYQRVGAIGSNALLMALAGVPSTIAELGSLRVDEGGELRVKQIAIIRRSMQQLVNRLVASTGTANYNHVTSFDVLPAQLGAAVPWELLGTAWTTSLTALDQSTAQLFVVIEKPTRLMDIIGCELVVRFSQIVWKNGSLRFATWGTPTAATAEHALTESNKATPVDTRDNLRTVTNETDRYLVNVVKLMYARTSLSGGYSRSITITDKGSITDHGERKPIEIEMRNTFTWRENTLDAIDELADGVANILSIFARPMHMMRRTIDLAFYEDCAPGDYCTVTDLHARNPSTGLRGLTNKPGLIVGHRYSLGGYEIDTGSKETPHGEVDILLMPFDNIAAYSPCADIASYVAGTKVATCTAHAYSESTEVADATRFPVGSKVRWVEIDPDAPGSPGTGVDTVAAQSGNDITLTTGIGSYSVLTSYRIIADDYATSTTDQRAKVYQADDADGLVAAGVNPYEYGNDIVGAGVYTGVTGTEKAALYSTTAYGKGIPLDVGYERDIARLCNNLQNYRTAPVMSSMSRSIKADTAGSNVYSILEIIPVHIGPGDLLGGDRFLSVAPWYRSSDGTSVTLTVSLCRAPPSGDWMSTYDVDAPSYTLGTPLVSASWTTTSTTWAAGAAADLSCRVLDSDGIGFLVVERTGTATQTRGLLEMFVSEYTS